MLAASINNINLNYSKSYKQYLSDSWCNTIPRCLQLTLLTYDWYYRCWGLWLTVKYFPLTIIMCFIYNIIFTIYYGILVLSGFLDGYFNIYKGGQ